MARSLDLLRREPRARIFMAAHAQSAVGSGAAYVGLLLLAFDRLPSPWALTLVLLADFLPAMLLGPVFGAAADRWSRRRCAVASDVARAVAFVGIALVDSYAATVALALLAGAGSGLFVPAVLAGLPSLVHRTSLPAATSLYGALDDFGHTLGPALAAALLLGLSPEVLMLANGATFAVSALALTRVPFGDRPSPVTHEVGRRSSLVAEARSGLAATARMSGVRTLLLASAAVILFAGMFNVGELLLAEGELGAGDAGFSALVAVFGAGVIGGSLVGGRGGPPAALKRRFLVGLLAVAAGFGAAGLAPTYVVALGAFLLAGVGNGLVLVHERLILQGTVPNRLMGRVFGVRDAIGSWSFAAAFVGAGAILTLVGTRPLFLIAGAGVLLVWVAATVVLRGAWEEPEPAAPAGELAREEVAGKS
ncbi:MAG: MFS transporter [Thermoleophilaceae bacterium]|nr:MFS transporter [Thermoleophilaceae bacterium]